jgi:LysM repeat protein
VRKRTGIAVALDTAADDPSQPSLFDYPLLVWQGDAAFAPLPEAVVRMLNSNPITNEPSREIDERGTLEPQPLKSSGTSASTVASAEKPNPEPKIVSVPPSPPSHAAIAKSAESPTPVIEKPTIIRTVHTVQSGESLGKIAAKYYGRSTPARIEAIFKANRDRLKATHQVKAEQKLDIPDLGEANSAFEPVSVLAMTDFSLPWRGWQPGGPSPWKCRRTSTIGQCSRISSPARRRQYLRMGPGPTQRCGSTGCDHPEPGSDEVGRIGSEQIAGFFGQSRMVKTSNKRLRP